MKKKILIATLTLVVLVGSVVACNKNNGTNIENNNNTVIEEVTNNDITEVTPNIENNDEVEATEEPIATEVPVENNEDVEDTTDDTSVLPEVTPEPTSIPEITATPAPTAEPSSSNDEGEVRNEEPKETETPKPEVTAEPVVTPAPTATPIPTSTPETTKAPEVTPVPTEVPTVAPTQTPVATATPQPQVTPQPTATPEPVCEHAGLQYTGKILRREQWAVGRCHEELQWFEMICPHCGITFEAPNPTGCNPEHPVTENPGSYGPTCTTEGYYAGAQCDCGQVHGEPHTIPAAGHRYEITQLENVFHHGEELYPDDPALAAQSGWTEYHYEEKCRICGDVTRNWWSLDATEAW